MQTLCALLHTRQYSASPISSGVKVSSHVAGPCENTQPNTVYCQPCPRIPFGGPSKSPSFFRHGRHVYAEWINATQSVFVLSIDVNTSPHISILNVFIVAPLHARVIYYPTMNAWSPDPFARPTFPTRARPRFTIAADLHPPNSLSTQHMR
jgi:hypothetical protein